MAPPSSSTLFNVTVVDADALHCGACFLPLKAPIFQCEVGHLVCAPCLKKLVAASAAAVECGVCGAKSGFSRCHAMERLVESLLVPCPHAAHGCAARPVYFRRDAHARWCEHAPCRCPDEACPFVASTAELLPHFAAAHGWPCVTKTSVGEIVKFNVQLRDGFNFVRAVAAGGGQKKNRYHLFLLNMARGDAGCAIHVLCVHPQAQATPHPKEMKFELEYSRHRHVDGRGSSGRLVNHYQKSEFRVVCTDLSDGLPDANDGFLFVVPWPLLGEDEDTIQVTASAYFIN